MTRCPKCSKGLESGALRVEVSIDSLDPEVGAASSARVVLCVACASSALGPFVELAQRAGSSEATK